MSAANASHEGYGRVTTRETSSAWIGMGHVQSRCRGGMTTGQINNAFMASVILQSCCHREMTTKYVKGA